jgi:hypothetical protein
MPSANHDPSIPSDLARALGTRRKAFLQSVMRQTGLPADALLDLALEILDIASRRLAPPPVKKPAVALAAARWRKMTQRERSEELRRVALARWRKSSEDRDDNR